MDYSHLKKIKELSTNGVNQVFAAEVVNMANKRSARNKSYATVTVRDETGYAEIFLFLHQRFQLKSLEIGKKILVTGKVSPGRTAKSVSGATFSYLSDEIKSEGLGILPIYNLSGNLTQNNVRYAVKQALTLARKELPESLPEEIIIKNSLLPRLDALENIHFPKNFALLARAKERFIFEELYLLQCGLLYYRSKVKDTRGGIKMAKDGKVISKVLAKLPFTLTEAQAKAWNEISLDMMGDVIGDLNTKRGRILGMQSMDDGMSCVKAQVPYAELAEYAVDLRALTQGLGTFEIKFDHYEDVPQRLAEKIIAERKAQLAEDK